MWTNTNTLLSNLKLTTPLSSSVSNMNLGTENYPTLQIPPKSEYSEDISSSWRDEAFNMSDIYNFHNEDNEKINTIVSFTQNLLENSQDIESEFVDIVNDNFWDLI